jgi:hypothetical protein
MAVKAVELFGTLQIFCLNSSGAGFRKTTFPAAAGILHTQVDSVKVREAVGVALLAEPAEAAQILALVVDRVTEVPEVAAREAVAQAAKRAGGHPAVDPVAGPVGGDAAAGLVGVSDAAAATGAPVDHPVQVVVRVPAALGQALMEAVAVMRSTWISSPETFGRLSRSLLRNRPGVTTYPCQYVTLRNAAPSTIRISRPAGRIRLPID